MKIKPSIWSYIFFIKQNKFKFLKVQFLFVNKI
ncbi:hypothetical protein VCSRO7_1665 [Vibrio cholerae]|nr:hypothetical protein DN34_635 [Vibrio cholerae]GHY31799.1 hypothetical protein VCSRO7_1665 [Vibrio cholerae]GIB93707.1 hypothetical protein VCSRO144_0700 [Vibrio cholerae]CAH2562875.1 hypothetical protein CNRVC190247_01126 [Vibrio cholerae]